MEVQVSHSERLVGQNMMSDAANEMKGAFRFKRITSHADYDVEVALEARQSDVFQFDTTVILLSDRWPDIRRSIKNGIKNALADCGKHFLEVTLVDIKELTGETPLMGFKICAYGATNELLGLGHKNPPGELGNR